MLLSIPINKGKARRVWGWPQLWRHDLAWDEANHDWGDDQGLLQGQVWPCHGADEEEQGWKQRICIHQVLQQGRRENNHETASPDWWKRVQVWLVMKSKKLIVLTIRVKVPDSRAQQGERRERKVYVGYHDESLTQVDLFFIFLL